MKTIQTNRVQFRLGTLLGLVLIISTVMGLFISDHISNRRKHNMILARSFLEDGVTNVRFSIGSSRQIFIKEVSWTVGDVITFNLSEHRETSKGPEKIKELAVLQCTLKSSVDGDCSVKIECIGGEEDQYFLDELKKELDLLKIDHHANYLKLEYPARCN